MPCSNSFDLFIAIRTTCQRLPVQITLKWVEGHQAEKGKRLDWWASKNQTVDSLAKHFWNTCQSQHRPNHPQVLRNKNLYISHKGVKLSTFQKGQMYADLYGPQTLQYWRSKPNFSSEHLETFMWPEAKEALRRLPFGLQRFWIKLATGFLGTGRKQIQQGYQEHDNCPQCAAPDEDNLHILRCPVQHATEKWQDNLQALRWTLQHHSTAPSIVTAIIENLQAWRTYNVGFI